MKWSARSALKKQPSDWELTTTVYPVGRNPWFDVYPETKVAEIGQIIGLTKPNEIWNLRLLLAHAAGKAYRDYRLMGGPASNSRKRDWAADAMAGAKKLRITLVKGEGAVSTDVRMTERDGKKVARIIPSSVVETSVSELIAAIDKFIKLAEPAANQSTVKAPSGVVNPSSHSIFVQLAVDLVTEVFIHFRGVENVKRISDKAGVYGEYRDFCRSAADPILSSYYPGYERRRSKLDGQIQDAVARYSGRKQ